MQIRKSSQSDSLYFRSVGVRAKMADKVLNEMIDLASIEFGVEKLKSEQREILFSLLNGRDCMAVLPTGFGKSLPYQMLIPLVRRLKSVPIDSYVPETRKIIESFDEKKIIVCCPLVSLMNDQVKRLEAIKDLHAAYKGSSDEADEQIKMGNVDIIFASPETLVGDSSWRHHLQNLKVGVIVIDEFHTVTMWGGDEDTEEHQVFRKWFRYIGELRSLFPNASVLALTATCTNKIRKHVLKVMSMKTINTTFITVSPNRANIKLVVKKIDNSIDISMFWMVESLDRHRSNFPKTLVYANSITEVAKLYNYIVSELPHCQSHVEMFHSETSESTKEKIIDSLSHDASEVRVVIATNALGMGIDAMGFHGLVLYGAPKNILDFVQELGRVGRDGVQSVAILSYNSYHLRNVDKDVKSVYMNTNCRRQSLMSHFLMENEIQELDKEMNLHTCCDICAEKCSCGNCELLPIESLMENVPVNSSTDDSDSDTIDYDYKTSTGSQVYFSSDDDFLEELEEI